MLDDFVLLQRHRELVRRDADRERGHPNECPVLLNSVRRALEAEDARARRDEVARVVVRVESDEVRLQDAAQQLLAVRQRAVVLGGGEGRVQEEADLKIGGDCYVTARPAVGQRAVVLGGGDRRVQEEADLKNRGDCQQSSLTTKGVCRKQPT